MEITHLGHACVLVETDGGARLLIDPGTLAEGFEQIVDLDAVLLTHQHPDHVDPHRLPALLAANPRAELVADTGTAGSSGGFGRPVRAVSPGERLVLGGTRVDVLGGSHAPVHPDLPVVPNVAYLIDDGAFFHPGDSFALPGRAVDVLALPVSGPWMKLGEAVDYLRSVSPRAAVPVHERAAASTAMAFRVLAQLCPPGTDLRPLPVGERTSVG